MCTITLYGTLLSSPTATKLTWLLVSHVYAALYQGGQMPDSARKLQVFEDMLEQVPGIEWYNIKKHQNWCSLQEKALRAPASKSSKSSEVGYFKMDAEVVGKSQSRVPIIIPTTCPSAYTVINCSSCCG